MLTHSYARFRYGDVIFNFFIASKSPRRIWVTDDMLLYRVSLTAGMFNNSFAITLNFGGRLLAGLKPQCFAAANTAFISFLLLSSSPGNGPFFRRASGSEDRSGQDS